MQRDLPVEMSLEGNVRKRISTMWAKLQRVWVGWGWGQGREQGVGRLSSEVEGRRGDFLCSDVHFT